MNESHFIVYSGKCHYVMVYEDIVFTRFPMDICVRGKNAPQTSLLEVFLCPLDKAHYLLSCKNKLRYKSLATAYFCMSLRYR